MVDAGMRDNAQELVEEWPGNGPRKGAFRKFPKQPSGLFMPRTGTDFRVDENVGVDRLRRSPAIHEVEELVAIQDVNAGLELGVPPLELQRVSVAPRLGCQALPQQLVDQSGEGLALSGGASLERLQEIVIECQGGPLHASKCSPFASRSQGETLQRPKVSESRLDSE